MVNGLCAPCLDMPNTKGGSSSPCCSTPADMICPSRCIHPVCEPCVHLYKLNTWSCYVKHPEVSIADLTLLDDHSNCCHGHRVRIVTLACLLSLQTIYFDCRHREGPLPLSLRHRLHLLAQVLCTLLLTPLICQHHPQMQIERIWLPS